MRFTPLVSAFGFFLALAASSQAADGYQVTLTLDGIKGGSTVAGHVGAIDVISYVAAIDQNTLGLIFTGQANGGGKAQFKPLTVTKYVDIATPPLVIDCAVTRQIKTATLTVELLQDGYAPQLYFQIVLIGAYVQSISESGQGLDASGAALETVSFLYKAIKYTYVPPDGAGQPVSAEFNVVSDRQVPLPTPTPPPAPSPSAARPLRPAIR